MIQLYECRVCGNQMSITYEPKYRMVNECHCDWRKGFAYLGSFPSLKLVILNESDTILSDKLIPHGS